MLRKVFGSMWFPQMWFVYCLLFSLRDMQQEYWLLAGFMAVLAAANLCTWWMHIKSQEENLWLSLENLTRSSLSQSQSQLYSPQFQASLRANPSVLPSAYPSVLQNANPYPLRLQEAPYVGIRSWLLVDDGRGRPGSTRRGTLLRATTREAIWLPGVNEAGCVQPALLGGRHPTPHPDCSCGFYGLSLGLRDGAVITAPPLGVVMGIFVAWGVVLPSPPYGFRAQYVQVIALLDDGRLHTKFVAERYGVPMLSDRGLRLYASEYGQFMKRISE